MTTSMIDRYRRWFKYEKDSHAKTLDSLNTVPEELRQSEEFHKVVYLLGHIIAARRMWLFRFGVLSNKVELFPEETSFDDLSLRSQRWRGFGRNISVNSTMRNSCTFLSIRATKVRDFRTRLRIS